MDTGQGATITLSIIVVSHGRASMLERCLLSLRQSYERLSEAENLPRLSLEILVRLNGEDLASRSVLEHLARQLTDDRGKLRFHWGEFKHGLSPAEARNRMIPEATGEWVLFIDDDAFVDNDYFTLFLKMTREFADSAAVGGPNLTPAGSSPFQRASGVALASRLATFFSFPRYRATGSDRLAGEEHLILCNLFIRREALGNQPFPPSFVCGEENCFLLGLRARGLPMAYSPKLHVWHERRPDWKRLALQVFRYGWGRAQNLRQRPTAIRFAHLVPSLCLLYTAGFFSLGASSTGSFIWIFALPFATYPMLCLLAGIHSARRSGERLSTGLRAAAIFPVIHACYGAGVLAGMIGSGALSFDEGGSLRS